MNELKMVFMIFCLFILNCIPPQKCYPLKFKNCSKTDIRVSIRFGRDTTQRRTEYIQLHPSDSIMHPCAIRESMNEAFWFFVEQDNGKILKKKKYFAKDLKYKHFTVYFCDDFK